MTTGKSRGTTSNSCRRRSTSRADDANRRGGARHENRTAREEGGQDLVAQTRVRRDQSSERITRNGEHFAGFGDSGGNEYPLARQEIQFAEEPAGRVAGDDAVLTSGVDNDLDGAGKDDVELVAGVAFPIQIFTGRYRSANAERLQHRQLRVVQLQERICLSSQGSLILLPFERSATRPAQQRCPRARVRTATLPEACGESVSRAPSSCIAT